jgi:hypothetical protein
MCRNLTAELLGFDDYIPAHAAATDDDILKGVNYASAAAGIRDETGRQLVLIFPMNLTDIQCQYNHFLHHQSITIVISSKAVAEPGLL